MPTRNKTRSVKPTARQNQDAIIECYNEIFALKQGYADLCKVVLAYDRHFGIDHQELLIPILKEQDERRKKLKAEAKKALKDA